MVDFEELQVLWDETQADLTWNHPSQSLCPTPAGRFAGAPLSPPSPAPPPSPQSPVKLLQPYCFFYKRREFMFVLSG